MPKSSHSKLPQYVKRDVTRHGTERFYLRLPGRPGKIRLPGEPGSPEFLAAYEEGLKTPRPEIGESRTLPGTMDQIIVSLYKSQGWQSLASSTRDGHRYRLEQLRGQFGKLPVGGLDTKRFSELVSELTPVNQKNWIKTFRILYRHAIPLGLAETDPSKDYPLPKIVSRPHLRWEDEDIRQFEAAHPVGSKARLCFDLFRYTGLRKSDVVKLGPQHVHKGVLKIKTQKTSEYVVLPLDPRLAETIAATRVVGLTTFLVTKHNKPHTVKGLGNYLRDWCNEAGLPDLSGHGIRHTIGAQMSEEGATVTEIMAVLGHRDPRMAIHYTRQASQEKLAASAFEKLMRRDR